MESKKTPVDVNTNHQDSQNLSNENNNNHEQDKQSFSYMDHIIEEIKITEHTYVRDLSDVIRGYIQPLRKQANMTKTLIYQIFSNIKQIYRLNRQLYKDLTLCYDATTVSQCFIQYSERFKIYSAYSSNYPIAINTLDKLLLDKEYVIFFTKLQTKLKHALPLHTYLFKPIQRILKYHLLFKALLAHADNDQTNIINQGLNCMINVAEHINEIQRQVENLKKVQENLKGVQGMKGINLTKFGSIINEGNFVGTNKEHFNVWLFEKAIFVVKQKRDGQHYLKAIFESSSLMFVGEITKNPLSFCLISVGEPKMKLTLQAENFEVKELWCCQIKKAILKTDFNKQIDELLIKNESMRKNLKRQSRRRSTSNHARQQMQPIKERHYTRERSNRFIEDHRRSQSLEFLDRNVVARGKQNHYANNRSSVWKSSDGEDEQDIGNEEVFIENNGIPRNRTADDVGSSNHGGIIIYHKVDIVANESDNKNSGVEKKNVSMTEKSLKTNLKVKKPRKSTEAILRLNTDIAGPFFSGEKSNNTPLRASYKEMTEILTAEIDKNPTMDSYVYLDDTDETQIENNEASRRTISLNRSSSFRRAVKKTPASSVGTIDSENLDNVIPLNLEVFGANDLNQFEKEFLRMSSVNESLNRISSNYRSTGQFSNEALVSSTDVTFDSSTGEDAYLYSTNNKKVELYEDNSLNMSFGSLASLNDDDFDASGNSFCDSGFVRAKEASMYEEMDRSENLEGKILRETKRKSSLPILSFPAWSSIHKDCESIEIEKTQKVKHTFQIKYTKLNIQNDACQKESIGIEIDDCAETKFVENLYESGINSDSNSNKKSISMSATNSLDQNILDPKFLTQLSTIHSCNTGNLNDSPINSSPDLMSPSIVRRHQKSYYNSNRNALICIDDLALEEFDKNIKGISPANQTLSDGETSYRKPKLPMSLSLEELPNVFRIGFDRVDSGDNIKLIKDTTFENKELTNILGFGNVSEKDSGYKTSTEKNEEKDISCNNVLSNVSSKYNSGISLHNVDVSDNVKLGNVETIEDENKSKTFNEALKYIGDTGLHRNISLNNSERTEYGKPHLPITITNESDKAEISESGIILINPDSSQQQIDNLNRLLTRNVNITHKPLQSEMSNDHSKDDAHLSLDKNEFVVDSLIAATMVDWNDKTPLIASTNTERSILSNTVSDSICVTNTDKNNLVINNNLFNHEDLDNFSTFVKPSSNERMFGQTDHKSVTETINSNSSLIIDNSRSKRNEPLISRKTKSATDKVLNSDASLDMVAITPSSSSAISTPQIIYSDIQEDEPIAERSYSEKDMRRKRQLRDSYVYRVARAYSFRVRQGEERLEKGVAEKGESRKLVENRVQFFKSLQ